MLLGLLGECKGCRLFRGFFQRFTAKISYSLYLTHILLLVPATRIAAKIYDNASAAPLSWLAGFTVLFIISALFSTIIWNYVERPFIIWAKQSNNALPWKKAL
jgi:peptidoglycan/LPS O-acetylase OafA/YrhL